MNENTDVALGAFVWNEKYIQEILADLESFKFPGRIILGGPQITYVKSEIEKFYPQGNVFIRGYAEDAMVKLMKNSKQFLPIKGVHYAGQPDLGLSASVDLESLASPFLSGLIQPQPFIRWETQRGCPFRCAFCQHRESDRMFSTRRQFDLARVYREADWITSNKIIQDVAVLDPIFNSGPNYLGILDRLIEGRYTGKLALQSRIEMVRPEFLDRVCKLNETAHVVLEFGLQTIHAEEQALIDRPNNMKKVARILDQVNKRGISVEISLIFGLPRQTLDSFKKSIEFCVNLKVPVIHAFPLMLLRGTPLYYQKKKLGLVESNEVASDAIDRLQNDIPHVVASPSFSYDEWRQMAAIAASLTYEKTSSA